MARSNPLTDTSLAARPASPGASLAGQSLARPRRSLLRDAVARFLANRLAVVGLGIVVFLLVFAVFADDWFLALPLGREAVNAILNVDLPIILGVVVVSSLAVVAVNLAVDLVYAALDPRVRLQ